MANGSREVTSKQWDVLMKQLQPFFAKSYNSNEKVVDTDVKCPVCNTNVGMSIVGTSVEIKCTTKDCIYDILYGI